MDVIKIGKFIATKRKEHNLTQSELADRLHVTDRAVSKWECGRSTPDSSIMLELCEILGISVNELLTGEELQMEEYNKQAETNLIEMTKRKEESDKRLLTLEVVVGIISTIFFLGVVLIAVLAKIYLGLITWATIVIIVTAFILFVVVCFFLGRIEQKAGYYECKECGYRYVPTYMSLINAPHIGRTRYMKCPHCQKKSWQKKVISEKE